MNIQENINKIKQTIPKDVLLIAVSKTKPIEDIMEAYNGGQRVFGENKAQEMRDKHEKLPKDIQWHFIGHLQENKVKYIVPYVAMIHSIDSLHLLSEINKKAIQCDRVIDCLFEIDIAHEESKFGMSKDEVFSLLSNQEYKEMKNVRICGVMGIGSITDNKEKTKEEFKNLKEIFFLIKENFFANKDFFKHISMGMSGDYDIAIKQGSTMIRVGSKIFGERDYSKKIND
jgi:pyridoxal phosphate enzyme (YggS family)